MTREEMCQRIRLATTYRSGADSCNSVYMGSLAKANLCNLLGGLGHPMNLDVLLAKATDAQLSIALDFCAGILDHADKHPTTTCPCCGQIMPAKTS